MGEPAQVGGGITRTHCLDCGWTEIDLTETAVPAKLASRKPMWQ